jgi:hypothetical protein
VQDQAPDGALELNEALCAICGSPFRNARQSHCWRVGGHLETGCGCQTRTLNLAPRAGQHYFKPASDTGGSDLGVPRHMTGSPWSDRRALVEVESLRLRLAEIIMLLDSVTGLTPREVRESHLEDVRRARKLAASA